MGQSFDNLTTAPSGLALVFLLAGFGFGEPHLLLNRADVDRIYKLAHAEPWAANVVRKVIASHEREFGHSEWAVLKEGAGWPHELERLAKSAWSLRSGDVMDEGYPAEFLKSLRGRPEFAALKGFDLRLEAGVAQNIMDVIITAR